MPQDRIGNFCGWSLLFNFNKEENDKYMKKGHAGNAEESFCFLRDEGNILGPEAEDLLYILSVQAVVIRRELGGASISITCFGTHLCRFSNK